MPGESPYLYVGGNLVVRIDIDGLYWIDTNGDDIADTWVLEEPIYAKSEPQDDEAMIRPRYGRLFGLGFLAVGEVAGHNDFFRAWTGTDPFSTQQISKTERVISGILAAAAVAPTGWKSITFGRPLRKMGHAFKHFRQFQKIDPLIAEADVARILEYVRMIDKNPVTQSNGNKLYSAIVEVGGKSINVQVVETVDRTIKTGWPVGVF
ncbi:MAG: pre-toxin TG domain-containing protein [bacterium]